MGTLLPGDPRRCPPACESRCGSYRQCWKALVCRRFLSLCGPPGAGTPLAAVDGPARGGEQGGLFCPCGRRYAVSALPSGLASTPAQARQEDGVRTGMTAQERRRAFMQAGRVSGPRGFSHAQARGAGGDEHACHHAGRAHRTHGIRGSAHAGLIHRGHDEHRGGEMKRVLVMEDKDGAGSARGALGREENASGRGPGITPSGVFLWMPSFFLGGAAAEGPQPRWRERCGTTVQVPAHAGREQVCCVAGEAAPQGCLPVPLTRALRIAREICFPCRTGAPQRAGGPAPGKRTAREEVESGICQRRGVRCSGGEDDVHEGQADHSVEGDAHDDHDTAVADDAPAGDPFLVAEEYG